VLLVAGAARAASGDDKAAASQFFRAGTAAYARHDYRAAAAAFEEAFRRVPRAAAKYNAARAWDAADEDERAADAYAAALAKGDLDSSDAERARARLTALDADFALLRVTGPSAASVAVDGRARGPIGPDFRVRPGKHDVTLETPANGQTSRSVDVPRAGAIVEVVFEPEPEPAAPPRVSPPPSKPPPSAPIQKRAPAKGGGASAWVFVTAGAAVVLAGGAAYTYVRFRSQRSEFDDGGYHDQKLRDSASRYRTLTFALGATALALGATSITLAVAGPQSPETAARLSIRGVF